MMYLILAIASSAMVSVCMRLSEKHVNNEMGMFTANYAVCIVLSFFYLKQIPTGNNAYALLWMLFLGILSGILYLVSFVVMKVNMKHNGIVLTSTFMKLGVLIPTLMAVFVFGETPGWARVCGILLALIAIITIHFEKDSVQVGSRKSWLIGLLILSGFTDAMANIYEQVGDVGLKDGYLLITFLAAFLCALILALRGNTKIGMKDVFFGFLIGIPNYFSARFLLWALGQMDAVLVYPMYSIGTIIAVTLVGVLFFKEKLSKKKVIALGMIGIALCLLNV